MNTETTDFKQKVQSMSAKEIIMAMVDGLKNPVIAIRMSSFGEEQDGVCFGCAATNTVCQISRKVFTTGNIIKSAQRSAFIGTDETFLCTFEGAIDHLRKGNIKEYNECAKFWKFAMIEEDSSYLPFLYSDYTQIDLEPYIDLADVQN